MTAPPAYSLERTAAAGARAIMRYAAAAAWLRRQAGKSTTGIFRESEVIRGVVLIAVAALLPGCAGSIPAMQRLPGGHQPGEEAAVLEATDRYFKAISEKDVAAQAAMQTSDGMTYQWRPTNDGGMHITANPRSYWSDPSRNDGRVIRERYWSPSVMIRGGIAVVWAPYEFWIDGKTNHCGIDVLDFVRVDGKWLVANAMWTVEPSACTELRPVETSTLRRKD